MSAEIPERSSFLAELFRKEAIIRSLRDRGFSVNSALTEVQRQIGQALKGNLITGEGVTKSGNENR